MLSELAAQHGVQTAMRLVVNRAAAQRGRPAPWPERESPAAAAALDELGDLTQWGAAQLGAAYAQILDDDARDQGGVYYTPEPIADALVFGAVAPRLLDRRTVRVLDPACGAGVLLESAACLIAGRSHSIRPETIGATVYGMDIDPVAVELAQAALWLRTDGSRPLQSLEGNVVCADPLSGESPPRLGERPHALAMVGNPPWRGHAKGSAPWVEARRAPGEDPAGRPSMGDIRPTEPRQAHTLASLAAYFWRFALWRAFEVRSGPGVVVLITPSAYRHGAAYTGLRRRIRQLADSGWVIDLTPEGLRPPAETRLWPGVQIPLCITVLARTGDTTPEPADILHLTAAGTAAEKARTVQAACSAIHHGPPGGTHAQKDEDPADLPRLRPEEALPG